MQGGVWALAQDMDGTAHTTLSRSSHSENKSKLLLNCIAAIEMESSVTPRSRSLIRRPSFHSVCVQCHTDCSVTPRQSMNSSNTSQKEQIDLPIFQNQGCILFPITDWQSWSCKALRPPSATLSLTHYSALRHPIKAPSLPLSPHPHTLAPCTRDRSLQRRRRGMTRACVDWVLFSAI